MTTYKQSVAVKVKAYTWFKSTHGTNFKNIIIWKNKTTHGGSRSYQNSLPHHDADAP
jgi:hypothetical protein